jgi:hypothetical protein
MRLCRFGDSRLGLVEGSNVRDVTAALDVLPSYRQQVFNLSGVYETPRFSGTTLRMLASGWHLSSIVRLQTGPYFTVLSGLDQARTGQTTYERPNQVLADPNTPGNSIIICTRTLSRSRRWGRMEA